MDILQFRGKYAFLSNFYPSEIIFNNNIYATVEHFYQAMKATNEHDHNNIRLAYTPGHAKKLGKTIQLVSNWNDIRNDIMLTGLRLKFNSTSVLYKKLLETRPNMLYEGNTWNDTYWGVDLQTKKGKNTLGILLMSIRDVESEWFNV